MIELRDISFSYGVHTVLKDLSLVIAEKQGLLISGPNGVGKSTLINLIAGALQPTRGEILFDGVKISTLSLKEQARHRSLAPQRRVFSLAFTVSEVLGSIPGQKNRGQIIDALRLGDVQEKKVTELSVGQQQRVSLAMTFLQESTYYFLDEPFSAQDNVSISSIMEYINSIKRDKGVVVVSHNIDAALFDRHFTVGG
jgi:ABC-type cobalamin/Fe3+-siderophores transport system ATPase subunit